MSYTRRRGARSSVADGVRLSLPLSLSAGPSTCHPLVPILSNVMSTLGHFSYTKFTADHLLEFKEIRKEWKARKKEEEAQRKAVEERERAAAQAAQANQVEAPNPSDPSHGQPPAYGSGVRPQLPPIGYQPADSQVPGQYGAPPGGGMVYQNGQMAYPPNYPHSPYQSGPVYPQRE